MSSSSWWVLYCNFHFNLGSSVSPSRGVHNINSGLTDHFGTGVDRGPDSDGSSSGSTTLSATSSPGGAGNGIGSRIGDGNLSGNINIINRLTFMKIYALKR